MASIHNLSIRILALGALVLSPGAAARAQISVIAAVRLSAIGAKGFNLKTDLLIDQAEVERTRQESLAKRKARIQAVLEDITPIDQFDPTRYEGDWLMRGPDTASTFQMKLADDGRSATLALANGLIARTFYLGENLVCFSLRQMPASLEFLRSVKPEATIE